MAKNRRFERYIRQYKNEPIVSGRRHDIFQKMKNCATTFDHWKQIYLYGDGYTSVEAIQKMQETVLDGKSVSKIRVNILELFDLVTDSGDQKQVMEAYLQRHCQKDDYIFILALMEIHGFPMYDITPEAEFAQDSRAMLERFYKRPSYIDRSIEKRKNTLYTRLEKSRFVNQMNIGR